MKFFGGKIIHIQTSDSIVLVPLDYCLGEERYELFHSAMFRKSEMMKKKYFPFY